MSAPYYADEQVALFLGDWRELIPADYTADLILTDPPYGETSLEWDRWPTGWPTLAARHATVTETAYDAHGFYNVTLDATDPISLQTDFKKCAVRLTKV